MRLDLTILFGRPVIFRGVPVAVVSPFLTAAKAAACRRVLGIE